MFTLYYHPAGLKISYRKDRHDGTLFIDDLNPENHIMFKFSRWELIKLGLNSIRAVFH